MADTCTATTAKGTQCIRKPHPEGQGKCKEHAGLSKSGRKTKLDREMIANLADLLEDGVLLKHAAAALEISERSLAKWREVGEADLEAGDEGSLFAQFVCETSRARAEGIIFHVKNLKKHAPTNVRASEFFLERTEPDHYSRRDKSEVKHSGQIANPVLPTDPEHNAEVLKILAETGGLDGLISELQAPAATQGDQEAAPEADS